MIMVNRKRRDEIDGALATERRLQCAMAIQDLASLFPRAFRVLASGQR
jgi:hypothetical protein